MSKEKKAGLLHASERDGVQYRRATWLQLILGNANNGCGICFYLLMMFASYVGTQGYGMASALVGGVLMVARVFDGFTDAIVAAIFERFPQKHGKIRIFLVVGWVLEALAVLFLFGWGSGKFSGVAGVVVFIVMYVLYIIGYTLNGISGAMVGIVITNDPTQRPMNGLISTLYSYLTPMIFNTILAFFVLPKFDNQYNLPMLKVSCYMYVAFAGAMVLLACIGLRKVDVEETFKGIDTGKKEKVKLRDMFAVLKSNRPAQMYILTCASDKFAQQVASQSVIATLLNGVLIGSYTVPTLVGNFSLIVGIAFAFLGGVYIAKNGSKKATIVWSWAAIILTVINLIFFIILGVDGMKSLGKMGIPVIIYAAIMMGTNAVKMVLTTTASSMRADVVDYELQSSGNYLPAIIGGVYSFIDKLITSVCSFVAGLAITAIGYVHTVPQMGDPATTKVFVASMCLSLGLPLIGWAINLIAMKFYSLDRETMIQVQKDIADKKEAVKAEAKAEAEDSL